MRKRIISIITCLALLVSTFAMMPLIAGAETSVASDDTCTITVNYVYAKNQAMVKQPYIAEIQKDGAFSKSIDVPRIENYTASGLGEFPDGVTFDTNEYKLNFNLQNVTTDIEINMYYTAGKAEYTVKHYYQNLENDDYAEPSVDDGTIVTVTGDIDAYTEAAASNKEGFTCTGVQQQEIAADGSTTVDIYYDRNYYTVVFDVNGGINGPKPIYAKYGTKISLSQDQYPTRAGYNFAGWNPNFTSDVEVTGNVTYTAQWTPKSEHSDYTIVIWGQNANDDEYSYLNSYEAYGKPGETVNWDESTLICEAFHVHSDNCYKVICGQEEHSHTADCIGCGKEEHMHGVSCYSGATSEKAYPQLAPRNPKNGQVYEGKASLISWSDIYINGQWYKYNGNVKDGNIVAVSCNKEEHNHSTNCYTKCGKPEHTHSNSCKELVCGITNTHSQHADKCYMGTLHPGKNLWNYERSEEVTINADGSTVLNVYFTRKEFTLTFKNASGEEQYNKSVTARWGADIKSEFQSIVKESGFAQWSTNYSSGNYTNYIGVMPNKNMTYYGSKPSGSGKTTFNYYCEVLPGETGTVNIGGQQYKDLFECSFYGSGYHVTKEDFYEFEGFSFNPEISTKENQSMDGAEFYYTRNAYNLTFYSASNSTPDRTESVKYQQNLGSYGYKPTNKPDTVESDAVFVGWYLNPECTGEQFDFNNHTMPANNIALYAKWVNGLYAVETFTDESCNTSYTYEGYTGKEDNIVKYELAKAVKEPTKEGEVFVGWFYKDTDGTEQPFSFTMPITQDYKLYPKFSDKVMVNYTIHYYIEGTTTKVADDTTGSAMIGSSITVKPKMGNELSLAGDKLYFPMQTSTSVKLSQADQEIVFYYKEATDMTYTVKYVDTEGNELRESETKTTKLSVVTEKYVPIENYTPVYNQQTLELLADAAENVITFVYTPNNSDLTIKKEGASNLDTYEDKGVSAQQTFIFNIKGVGDDPKTSNINLDVTIQGNGSVTVKDLPVGKYEVTELENWSWRYKSDGPKIIELNTDATKNNITFNNNRNKKYWLSGDDIEVNVFKPFGSNN